MHQLNRKSIIQMAGNVFLEQLFLMSILTVNGIMISHAGGGALSGVSIIDQVHLLMSFVFSCTAYGVVVVVAHTIGAGRRGELPDIGRQAYLGGLALGGLALLIGVALGWPLTMLLLGGTDKVTFDSGLLYLRIYSLSYPFYAFYTVSISILRGTGNTRHPMIISVSMNLLNMLLSALFIYVLDMGVAGAALSAILARGIAAVLSTVLILRAGLYAHFREFFTLRPMWNHLRQIIHYGLPMALENVIFQMGKIIINLIVVTLGAVNIEANAIFTNAMDLVTMGGLVAYTIGIPMMGWAKGEGNRDQMKKYMRMSLLLGHALLVLTAVCMLPLVLRLVELYNISPEALHIAQFSLIVYGVVSVVFWPHCFTTPALLRSAGDARVPSVLSVLVFYVIRIPAAYIYCKVFGMGAFGVALAMMTDWVFRSGSFIIRMASGKWLPPVSRETLDSGSQQA